MKRDLKNILRNINCVSDLKEVNENITLLLEKIDDKNCSEEVITNAVNDAEKSMLILMDNVNELQKLMLKFMINTK